MALARDSYLLTRGFPKEELYGLTSQLRRAAVSVPANIAEGSGRTTKKDFVNFLRSHKAACASWKPTALGDRNTADISEGHYHHSGTAVFGGQAAESPDQSLETPPRQTTTERRET